MLTARDSTSTLLADLVESRLGQLLTDVSTDRFRRERHGGKGVDVSSDQLALAPVPLRKQLRGRRSANETGVRNSREAHTRNVARGRVDTVNVPDGLAGAALELLSCGQVKGDKRSTLRLRDERHGTTRG